MTSDVRRSIGSDTRWHARAPIRCAFLCVTAAALLVLAAAHGAEAQCAFEHPKKATKLKASLVPAFVPCECYDDCQFVPGVGIVCTQVCGNAIDSYGHVACKPPETFPELSGTYDGWQWDESRSHGEIQLKVRPTCTGVSTGTSTPPCSPASPLNPPGTADLAVMLALKGVVTVLGPASGTGTLALILRVTLADPTGGDMSMVDVSVSFPFDVANGAARMTSSVDAFLNDLGSGLPGLPACTSVEVLAATVLDPNFDQFANMGIWLPGL